MDLKTLMGFASNEALAIVLLMIAIVIACKVAANLYATYRDDKKKDREDRLRREQKAEEEKIRLEKKLMKEKELCMNN